jgi:hypothetical protein
MRETRFLEEAGFLKERFMAKGYNRPMGGQSGILQQIQRMQQQLAEAQERLAEESVTATAGGGAIKVTMTGDQRCTAVEIAPELLKDTDADMLQDLILTAVNLALDKSRELQQQFMSPLTGGLPF